MVDGSTFVEGAVASMKYGSNRIRYGYDLQILARIRVKVHIAIKEGLLPPLDKCSNCSSLANVYHHHDYNKPLDVTPLCRRCHINWHREHPPVPMPGSITTQEPVDNPV